MFISVIVPFYNEEKYIGLCAKSLANQSIDRDKYEVIFVDNGSTDSSGDIVRAVDSNALILEEPKKSSYAARNLGVKKACGDWFVFTDGDCVVSTNWLEQIIKFVHNNTVDVIIGPSNFGGKSGLLGYFACYENMKMKYLCECRSEALFCRTNNLAIKANVLRGIGFFGVSKFGEDTIMLYRALNAYQELHIKFCQEMLITHLEIQNWMDWATKMSFYAKTSTLNALRKYKYRALSWGERFIILKNVNKLYRGTFFSKVFYLMVIILFGIVFDIKRNFEIVMRIITRGEAVTS